jgi:hypothetical protein
MKKELIFQKIIDIKYKWCYVSILLFFIIFNQENSMSESKIENFKFENYKTEEQAQKDLLELHPIGSDVELLISILKNAEFEESRPIISRDDINENNKFYGYFNKKIKVNQLEYKSVKVSDMAKISYLYQKNTGIAFLNTKVWKVGFWTNENNKLVDLVIIRYGGL